MTRSCGAATGFAPPDGFSRGVLLHRETSEAVGKKSIEKAQHDRAPLVITEIFAMMVADLGQEGERLEHTKNVKCHLQSGTRDLWSEFPTLLCFVSPVDHNKSHQTPSPGVNYTIRTFISCQHL